MRPKKVQILKKKQKLKKINIWFQKSKGPKIWDAKNEKSFPDTGID